MRLFALPALLGLAVAWLLSGPLTAQWDRPCLACHRSSSPAGSHVSVGCASCHAERGVLLGLVNTWLLTEETLHAVTGGRWDSGRRVEDAACLGCHSAGIGDTVTSERGLRMSHAEVIEAAWSCTECHGSAAHERDGVVGVTMSRCASCHNGEAASGGCGTCHGERTDRQAAREHDPEWSVTHGRNWRMTHGMGDLSACGLCHGPGKCAGCHGVDLPHPEEFGAEHSATAKERREDCVSCHRPSFCDNCHGMEMPHPQGFLAGHGEAEKDAGSQACEHCHVPSQCDGCHADHTHPGRSEPLRAPRRKYERGG
ncbi:MAG: hypothetical protein IBX62_10005 [Coriobacteriia bacterium]|nr:hypothetical protein [Coriobacteriia bacterium]